MGITVEKVKESMVANAAENKAASVGVVALNQEEPTEQKPFYKKAWFWGALTVGTIVAVVAFKKFKGNGGTSIDVQ